MCSLDDVRELPPSSSRHLSLRSVDLESGLSHAGAVQPSSLGRCVHSTFDQVQLMLLLGLLIGWVATALGGAVGGIFGACMLIFGRYLGRQVQSRGADLRIPLLSHEARNEGLEDEVSALRRRVALLEEENEMLRLSAAGSAAPSLSSPPKSARSHSSSTGPGSFISKLGTRTETIIAADRVAAEADGLAATTSSDLRVVIDNDFDEKCTVVRVTAPNRSRLLADLSAALSGLGLSIVKAQVSTVGALGQNTFYLQEVVLPGGGRKVWGTERLAGIEGRLRQFFHGQAVQRLLKAKSLARDLAGGHPDETPSWAQPVQEPTPEPYSAVGDASRCGLEGLLLASLAAAFGSDWWSTGSHWTSGRARALHRLTPSPPRCHRPDPTTPHHLRRDHKPLRLATQIAPLTADR